MRADFINFSDIDLNNPSSWKGKKIISFDIDWAIDETVEECVNIVSSADVKATFFVTHHCDVLNKITTAPGIELGIHPNFDPLINRSEDAEMAGDTIKELMEIVPTSKVIRSHGMTHSGRWLPLYKENDLHFSSQYFMNGVNSIQPFEHINGIVEAPVYFADDGLIFESDKLGWDVVKSRFSFKGIENYLCVYNFHPIHIALNTDSFEFYNSTRMKHKHYAEIKKVANTTKAGVKDILKELIK